MLAGIFDAGPPRHSEPRDNDFGFRMLSLILSTVAFFVATYIIRRQLDAMDMPKGMTRSVLIFTLAAAVSYGVAVLTSAFAG
jgi:hypothetical protein